MLDSLMEFLVDPETGATLRLRANRLDPSGEVVAGSVSAPGGREYPIVGGIPRFVLTDDRDQRQTEASFGYKWKRRETYDSASVRDSFGQWLLKRYGFSDSAEMRRYLSGLGRILDAGCGSGFSASVWLADDWAGEWVGADISEAVDIARERLSGCPNTHFVQADILQLPFPEGCFDAIFSEGVLHHTPSTEKALKALTPLLKPGGEFLFYVYRRKGPIREFSDDHVRSVLSNFGPEEAWAQLRPLTRLGQALAELKTEVEVPEDIPWLGIEAGRYDVQRLVYWHFIKLFWNNAYSFEENNHINFDWYHPRYAHRQTEDEVRSWCRDLNLKIFHLDAQRSGFTVRARKQSGPP